MLVLAHHAATGLHFHWFTSWLVGFSMGFIACFFIEHRK